MSHPPPRSTPFWAKPVYLVFSLIVLALISGGAVFVLQTHSEREYRRAAESDEMGLVTYHFYTSAWRAAQAFALPINTSPEAVAAEQQASLQVLEDAYQRYRLEVDEGVYSIARADLLSLGADLERARTLILTGEYSAAQGALIDFNSDYYVAADSVYEASGIYLNNAIDAARLARITTVAVYILSFLSIAAIFWLYRMGRRDLEEAASEREILRRSEARFRPLIQTSSDLFTVIDRDGSVLYASPAVEEFCGCTPEQVVGRSVLEMVAPDDKRSLYNLLNGVKQRPGYTATAELHLPALEPGGEPRYIQLVCTNSLEDPDVGGLVLNVRDISQRKALEGQLRQQAFSDPLTGLANRLRFTDRLEHALELGKRNGGLRVTVVYLDLDYFKNVNDELGHTMGDELLKQVAERLRSLVRSTDTAARLGGDEFAIILEDYHRRDDASRAAERILDEMKRPFQLGNREVYVSASIGVVVADPGETTAEDVIRDADIAMYDAKANGRGRLQVFDPSMQLNLVERAALTNDLHGSIERSELLVYYQPTLHLADRSIAGFEALVRWQHPTRGLLLPDRFINLAEDNAFIHELGYFVLYEACRQGKEWQTRYPAMADFTMSVNVSPRQLQKPGFVQLVQDVMEKTEFDPESLVLEITEGVLIRQPQEVLKTLRQLKLLGLHLALDDFGTGYSSLSYLKRFPIDILKIDRAFIEGMDATDRDRMLVQTVVDLGHTLNLDIVAEGIERDEQLRSLQKLNCALGQGFLFSRALDAVSAEAMLRDQSADRSVPSMDDGAQRKPQAA